MPELRKYYKQLLRELQRSQKLWLRYREASCSAVEASYTNGNGAGLGGNGCRLELTEQRIAWLKKFDSDGS